MKDYKQIYFMLKQTDKTNLHVEINQLYISNAFIAIINIYN